MKKIWAKHATTLVYLAPIVLALGACLSCSGSDGCNKKDNACANGLTPTTQSDGSIKCCTTGVTTC